MTRQARRLLAGAALAAFCLACTALGATRERELRIGFVAGSYWDAPTGNCYAVLDAAIARFEDAHPGVRVTYTSGILKQDYTEWLIDEHLRGQEPDVFMVLPEDFGMLYELGALEPLAGYLERDETVSAADFYPSALESGAVDGRQYALPYECVPTLMFVNKTLLEQAGIPLPGNDWTWDEFYDICARVTRDTDGDGTLDRFGSYGYTWRDALAANGAALFSTDGSVAFRPFLFSDYRTYQPYPWRIKRYSDFEWDCIQMPAGPSGANSSALSATLVSVGSRSSEKRLAWELLKELTCADETQTMLYTDSHGASALRRVTQSPETQHILRQDTPGESRLGLELLSDTLEHAVAAPHFRSYDQALLLTDSLVQTAMEDEHNLSLRLQRVRREVQDYLQD